MCNLSQPVCVGYGSHTECSFKQHWPNRQPPPLKAFMDDTTVISSNEKDTREILERLDVVVAAAGMVFNLRNPEAYPCAKEKWTKQ